MCAILGIISKDYRNKSNFLDFGLASMSHRGPDSHGKWISKDGIVGLGHNRLSIIDLTENGSQPMLDINKKNIIVFNGEIYNFIELKNILIAKGHKFGSRSDTEVILASYKEWGVKCLDHLNGMFAFAIYDSEKNIIFLARDRAGEKPLFYSTENEALLFSSEIKGIFAGNENAKSSVDLESLSIYLSLGYVPGGKSMVKNIFKLPPAHALLYDIKKNKVTKWKYWTAPFFENENNQSHNNEVNLIDELEELLKKSIKSQLVADVPVGVLLSGGLDSSIVTALASQVSPNIQAFTIGFKDFISHDETSYAKLIANHFGVNHQVLNASKVSPEILFKLAAQYDDPIADSSMIPTYLVSNLVRQHCKVALGGDGGDELFGGYHHYSRILLQYKYTKNIPRKIKNFIALMASSLLPLGFRGKNWLQNINADLENSLPMVAALFESKYKKELFPENDFFSNTKFDFESFLYSRIPKSNDLIQRSTRMDFENYMAEDILVKVDRASMLNSLEIRSPMLDLNVMEFAFRRVPSYLKASETNKKILLKGLGKKILPPNFDLQRKQGFSIPLKYWLKQGSFRNFFKDILLDTNSIFDKKSIEKIFKQQDFGCNNSERLFSLLMLDLWCKEYNISI